MEFCLHVWERNVTCKEVCLRPGMCAEVLFFTYIKASF